MKEGTEATPATATRTQGNKVKKFIKLSSVYQRLHLRLQTATTGNAKPDWAGVKSGAT